jgi:PAS domain S-box-containing protein
MDDGQMKDALTRENQRLRAKLEELEKTVRAIRSGKDDLANDLSGMNAAAEAKARLAQIVESSVDAIFSLTLDGLVDSWNAAAERLFGYTAREVIGQPALNYLVPQGRIDEAIQKFNGARSGKSIGPMDTVRRRKDGSEVNVSVMAFPILNARGEIVGVSVNVRDITERKQAEERLKLFRALLDQSTDSIEILDLATLRLLDVNEGACRALGYTREELLSMRVPDIDPMLAANPEKYKAPVEASGEARLESVHRRKDGSTFPVEVSIKAISFDKPYGLAIVRDISERKRAKEMLVASLDLLKSVLEHVPVRVFWKDAELRYLGCNTAFAHDAGMSNPEELIGKDDFQMGWREQAELYRADDKRVIDSSVPKLGYEEPQTAPDGRVIWLRTSKVPLRAADGKVFGMLGIYEDITERKRAETVLQHTTRALATLSEVNRALVHATDEHELMLSVCRAIVSQRRYRIAWVGYLEYDEAKIIRPIAQAGEEGYLEEAGPVMWADTELGQGPSGRAARSGQTQVSQNFLADEHIRPWRNAAIKYGLQSGISLPLINEGKVFGVLSIYAEQSDAFNVEETRLLEQMAGDLAFGVQSLHTRRERDLALEQIQRHLTQLRDNLEGTIKAISSIVEMRDPYTAGHEKRVAELAAAIARELGLSDERVYGLRLAGDVHDLGKIKIPAEILSKPGRLTDIEYDLIKVHPQAGYDILKDIDFPWPIAQTVLQHHERMDGSGYPQGLKGEQIIIEARIMGAADVVEAMHSHRPYRPGLGLEVAFNEIRRGRGIIYDEAIVDACLKLFQEGRFNFTK